MYILNIYYADDSYDAGLLGLSPMKLESIYSSKVFKAHYSYATEIQWDEEVSDKNIIWNEENHDDGKRTYTVSEIQDILGISRPTAYNIIASGVFKSVRVGRRIRISKRSFDEWLDKQI